MQLRDRRLKVECVLADKDVGVPYFNVHRDWVALGVDEVADRYLQRGAVGQELVDVGIWVPGRRPFTLIELNDLVDELEAEVG